MANAVYDHLVAIVVIGMIFVGTVVALPAVTYSALQTVDQQQLRNTALNVFDSMLLGVGSPSEWGSIASENFSQTNVTLFGLATPNPLSKFVLSSGKVQRLNISAGPGVGYEYIRGLLNLQDFGFRLSISRPFRVASYLNVTESLAHFSVTVTRAEDGTPIPKAEVQVTTVVTASSVAKNKTTGEYDLIYNMSSYGPYYTDLAGNCHDDVSVDLSGYLVNYAIAIMKINVGGMTATVVTQTENEITKYIKVNVFGDTMELTFRNESVDNPSERRVKAIRAFDSETFYKLFDSFGGSSPDYKITNGEGYITWTMTYSGLEALDPQALLFMLQLTVPGAHDGLPARRLVPIAGPYGFGDPEEIFGFGPNPGSENIIAIMRRLVVVSGNTYVAQIAFWRE